MHVSQKFAGYVWYVGTLQGVSQRNHLREFGEKIRSPKVNNQARTKGISK